MASSSITPQLPCDCDGICMVCKKLPSEPEKIACITCLTPWHVACLATLPYTLHWVCPDCTAPPPNVNGGKARRSQKVKLLSEIEEGKRPSSSDTIEDRVICSYCLERPVMNEDGMWSTKPPLVSLNASSSNRGIKGKSDASGGIKVMAGSPVTTTYTAGQLCKECSECAFFGKEFIKDGYSKSGIRLHTRKNVMKRPSRKTAVAKFAKDIQMEVNKDLEMVIEALLLDQKVKDSNVTIEEAEEMEEDEKERDESGVGNDIAECVEKDNSEAPTSKSAEVEEDRNDKTKLEEEIAQLKI